MLSFKKITYGKSTLWQHLYGWMSENSVDWSSMSDGIRHELTEEVEGALWNATKNGLAQSFTPRSCYDQNIYVSPINLNKYIEDSDAITL